MAALGLVVVAAGHPLDNPALSSLRGPHALFAQRRGPAVRYPPDVSPFLALPDQMDADGWRALAAALGPGTEFAVPGLRTPPPRGWTVLMQLPGVQMVDVRVVPAPDPEAVSLGAADVPEMLALVERTRPGPFLPRTVELGSYLGIRRGGRLVAMAGERMHPPGWTEVSAVCTDAEFRGRGLAARLMRAVVAGIRERGERACLHAAAANTGAIRLYEHLGFAVRDEILFVGLRAPGRYADRRGKAVGSETTGGVAESPPGSSPVSCSGV